MVTSGALEMVNFSSTQYTNGASLSFTKAWLFYSLMSEEFYQIRERCTHEGNQVSHLHGHFTNERQKPLFELVCMCTHLHRD